MLIIWSIIWGISVFVVMLLTIKYYIPEISRGDVSLESIPLTNEEKKRVAKECVIIFMCACFSALCGYQAAKHYVSFIGMLRMTLAMEVFSCIFITDLKFMIIPNKCSAVMLLGGMMAILFELVLDKEEALLWFVDSIIATISILIILIVVARLSHEGLGMGDVKLLSSFGFLCGIRAVCFTLFFAFVLCAIVATGLLIAKKKQLKDSLPLGPFIWLGYGVAVLLSII